MLEEREPIDCSS